MGQIVAFYRFYSGNLTLAIYFNAKLSQKTSFYDIEAHSFYFYFYLNLFTYLIINE